MSWESMTASRAVGHYLAPFATVTVYRVTHRTRPPKAPVLGDAFTGSAGWEQLTPR